MVAFGAMWAYILWIAPRDGVYRVTDAAWREQAEQICAEVTAERIALADTTEGYIRNPTDAQMLEHADLVEQATTLLAGMLDRLEALPLTGEKDRLRVATFLKYYRVVISDRERYIGRLRALDPRQYDETLLPEGGPVSNVVTDFTTGNEIKSCAPPGELGANF